MIGSFLVLSEGPELISLDRATEQCAVTSNADDSLIARLLTVARRHAERHTRLALVDKAVEYTIDRWPACRVIEVPIGPVRSVSGITYIDEDGFPSSWASSDYIVDVRSRPARIAVKSGCDYPSATLQPIGAITIALEAGYIYPPSSPQSHLALPQDIEHAILMAVGCLWAHRGDNPEFMDQSTSAKFLPSAFYNLLSPFRLRSL